MQEMHPPRNPAALPPKRVLIVNCYFDDSRQPIRRTNKIPQAVGPIYLAGAFARDSCDVRCYTELASGPLEDERLLAWPDMLTSTLIRLVVTRSKTPAIRSSWVPDFQMPGMSFGKASWGLPGRFTRATPVPLPRRPKGSTWCCFEAASVRTK